MVNIIKIGKIFDPRKYFNSPEYFGYAQSPQTIVFKDFVRIYFSTRIKDGENLYISKIAYVDFSIDLKSILKVSSINEVIEMGELGTFDEHGIFPISPYVEDNKIFAYTCGWSRRESVPVETGIGLVYSENGGNSFKRIASGPILSSSLNEPFLVGDAFVRKYNGLYYMWYIFGKTWKPSEGNEPVARIYKIAQSTSLDGVNWKKNEGVEIIPNVIGQDECQALPSVIYHKEKYHMVFCYRYDKGFRKNPKKGYKIGYAFSKDLISWERNDELLKIPSNENDWDSEMMCYPHLFRVEEQVYLLYNGNSFGKEGFGAIKLNFTEDV